MKRLLLLLSVSLCVAAYAAPAPQRDTLRLLSIGNSFSVDGVEQYLWEIADAAGVPVIIGNMYIGGCSLERHWKNAEGNIPDYKYRKIRNGKKQSPWLTERFLPCLRSIRFRTTTPCGSTHPG